MKGILKYLRNMVSFLLISFMVLTFFGCESKPNKPKYNCETCSDTKIIECPDCDTIACTGCLGEGYRKDKCLLCFGIRHRCYVCNGAGRIEGKDCKSCAGGFVNRSCNNCDEGYIKRDCGLCKEGYVFKEDCVRGSHYIPHDTGRYSIACPDCYADGNR